MLHDGNIPKWCEFLTWELAKYLGSKSLKYLERIASCLLHDFYLSVVSGSKMPYQFSENIIWVSSIDK